jgi:hypothetical protein
MIGEKKPSDLDGPHDAADLAMCGIRVMAFFALVGIFGIPWLAVLIPAEPNPILAFPLDPKPVPTTTNHFDICFKVGTVAWLFCWLTLFACGVIAVKLEEAENRAGFPRWRICRHCDRRIPRFNALVTLTWKRPHCGEDPRRKSAMNKLDSRRSGKDKKQPFPLLDPDF